MENALIKDVPQFFAPYIKDCFTNALASCLLHVKINPALALVDYLSFLYDPVSGFIGASYLYSPFLKKSMTFEELNSGCLFLNTQEVDLDQSACVKCDTFDDKINIRIYLTVDQKQAEDAVLSNLARHIPVIVAADLFYIPYHKAYQKEHGLHYIVLTGFDRQRKVFFLFDKYKLSACDFEGELPFAAINDARASLNPMVNPFIGNSQRPILNRWLEITVGEKFKITRDDVIAVIRESVHRIKGDKKVLGYQTGLPAIEAYGKTLEHWRQAGWDAKKEYLFRNYLNEVLKYIARNRKHFLHFLKTQSEITRELSEISALAEKAQLGWDIAANTCLKIAITRKDELIGNLVSKFKELADCESRLADVLFENYLRS